VAATESPRETATTHPSFEEATMSDVDTVRLLIVDLLAPPGQLFTDDQLTAFLTLESANIKRAAADALDAIAVSEALISKKITTQDLSTDGPAVAKALRDQAKALRDQAAVDDDTGDGFVFGIIEYQDGYTGPELSGIPSI
jgi:hypothetical protein